MSDRLPWRIETDEEHIERVRNAIRQIQIKRDEEYRWLTSQMETPPTEDEFINGIMEDYNKPIRVLKLKLESLLPPTHIQVDNPTGKPYIGVATTAETELDA